MSKVQHADPRPTEHPKSGEIPLLSAAHFESPSPGSSNTSAYESFSRYDTYDPFDPSLSPSIPATGLELADTPEWLTSPLPALSPSGSYLCEYQEDRAPSQQTEYVDSFEDSRDDASNGMEASSRSQWRLYMDTTQVRAIYPNVRRVLCLCN